MTQFDIAYHELAKEIMENGQEHVTRGVDPATGKQLKAKKLFHRGFLFNLQEEFPILTTKRMPKSKEKPENGFLFASELFWIYVLGSNKVADLRELGNGVWDEWELEDGTIGPAYGAAARQQIKITESHEVYIEENIDQVKLLIEGIKNDPMGRRHIIDLWTVVDLPDMGLQPCAFLTIWDVSPDGFLNCHLVQRSSDVFLGLPFNVSQYAMLVHMVAHVTGLQPGFLAHDMTNVHIYENHYPQIEKQLAREPKDCKPSLWLNPDVKNFDDFTLADIRIDNYEAHPGIKGDVAV